MEEVLIEPLYDRVVLDPIKEDRTDGGLIVPTSVQGKEMRKCVVVAVGPGKLMADTGERVPMDLSIGDSVFVNPMLGHAVKVDRKTEYLVQREEEVIGRLRPINN